MSPRYRRCERNKAQPVWHPETCADCGIVFDELSDPRASMHLCCNCMERRLGIKRVAAPLQQLPADDDWWTNFVYQYERQKILERGGESNDTTTHQ